MNCHQILSGACNAGDRCFATGSVEGVSFTAYAAGCNIVILASTFERVQIIPGAIHGYIKISALDCSTDTGKIAASYENKICIFEPTPILQANKHYSHFLDYRWVQTGSFVSHSHVVTLSWNLEGTRLLTGGTVIQLWKEKSSDKIDDDTTSVKFVIGGGGERGNKTPTNESQEENVTWENIWSCQTAIPIYHMAFSPDGTLFATCGRNDRLVKIWYENKQVLFPAKVPTKTSIRDDAELNFTYVYIAHPRAVTNIAWRRTSKYMPKGSVSNMIVTSCLDNICRIWIETVLPDDGLVNMTQFDPFVSQNPKFRTQRHKHRFMQRLKHMKTCFHIRRHAKTEPEAGHLHSNILNRNIHGPIPSLPSSCSVHDFHSYGFNGTGVSPGMHFHLAASINAETDIPLVPSMQSADPSNQNNFILHWLNNKEMHFTLQAEAILQELTKRVIDEENITVSLNNVSEHVSSEIINESKTKYFRSLSKSQSTDDNNTEEYGSNKTSECQNKIAGLQNMNSMSNTASLNSLSNDNNAMLNQLTDSLDIKIECLLRDWHQSPDLLFSVHPVDGSYLIWVIDWLDDYYPGSYRQAQVSFSTRIPSAFPLGDAMSMSTTVSLYNTGTQPLVFREIANSVKSKNEDVDILETPSIKTSEDAINKNLSPTKTKNDNSESTASDIYNMISNNATPSISMVTKHSNGTLNLWQLTFGFKTKFTQVLSVGHMSRASGHRFRVNDITCHPVLPLLVSTSHHNIPETDNKSCTNFDTPTTVNKDVFTPSGFCSELILWRVDPVGPLCYSGGVSELARINSPEISAFSNVAWIPTLLPSTTLGRYSNSPSACFVASDGENLRVYQAVIDARTLLAEISSSDNANILYQSHSLTSIYSNASSTFVTHKEPFHDKLKVVSQQSTARPGCIIQLDPISDAKHDWQNTQFLHVFQAQLIDGGLRSKSASGELNKGEHELLESDFDAIVDLQQSAEFEEPFYIVIIEKTLKGSTIHMWRIVISSKEQKSFLPETAMYVPDSNLTQDLEDLDVGLRRMSVANEVLGDRGGISEAPHISIKTEKVCTQELSMPDGVDVVHASPAAGHLSSSSIYPACYAPYIIVTACSDSVSRFWKCEGVDPENNRTYFKSYRWVEWKMLSRIQDSAIEIPGQPLNISAAYSGRIACAYKYGKSFTRPNKGDPDSRYINLCVAIYECESSGGSEWVLEDTIHLKNVHLPRFNIDNCIDLSYLHDTRLLQKKQRLNQVLHTFTHEDGRSPRSGETTPELASKTSSGLLAVPSFSTLQSLRKSIAENGNTCPLTQKHLVQLDWVSKEDGSHILTVAVGSKILLYTAVSSDIAQANIKAMKESRSANRPILRKASSLAQPHFNDEIRWMKLRQIDLQTADGLPPLPMQISWVRDGILVVAMDSEMHVYSQWKPRYNQPHHSEDVYDTRNLRDEDLRSLANESTQLRLKAASSIPLMSKVSTANLELLSNEKRKRGGNSSHANVTTGVDTGMSDDYMPDFGLFQASRIACPVLPQYHPKQLMELLNSGKVSWVKAILAHLVRCMNIGSGQTTNSEDNSSNKQRSWSRSRTLSISYIGDTNIQNEHRSSTTQVPEELMLDYAEIPSIPPLPLWVLLNADNELPGPGILMLENDNDYDELFEMNTAEDNLDDLLENEGDQRKCERKLSVQEKINISHFGPRQGQQLSRLLTHTHLPGLSSLDQMHLLALADTVSTCNTEFSERFAAETGKSANKDISGTNTAESLDDCGLRFLLAMKHFIYLLRCLPLNQRAQFQKNGIGTSNIVWAFHSESEEDLLNLIPSYSKGDLKWPTLRDLGVGFWVKNINTLRLCVEKLAKCAYQVKQDPLDAAIYYLAMKKKSIVWGLFRSKRDEKMTTFFSNNFSEDRWRKAALKNAFVLLGKQRFEHAVAFFLLANSLNDAIEVCINKLEDFQLALVIARLYEGDIEISQTSTYRKLLCEHVLGMEDESMKFDINKAHPDPFLRSITYWILKKYQESLNTLLLNGVGMSHSAYKEEDVMRSENSATNPNVFNFYIYLRTHPLLVRQNLALSAQEKKISHVVLSGFSYSGEKGAANKNDKQLQLEDTITPIERQLYFTTAHAHFKAGCPALALEVLNKLPTKIRDSNGSIDNDDVDEVKKDIINTGIIEWGQKADNLSTNFDWSTPINSIKQEDEFKIEWDNDENDENDEGSDIAEDENEKIVEKKNSDVNKEQLPTNEVKIDIMAQQLKFGACLKILMEELSTLATGFEVDGGQLRYQLYIWLEKEVEALKQLCNYCNSDNVGLDITSSADINEKNYNQNPIVLSEKPSLHEILMQEKYDFEAKVLRAAKRKKWLKANETLLRTLLSYCSLHGASGGGLASVRMELVLLLQELQQEKTQQQLLSPLPFPTTLPLLSACVAGNKTVSADPIKYLQSQTVDMLQTIVNMYSLPGFSSTTFCEIFILRDLAIALSSCIYQSLCDSDSFVVQQNNIALNVFQSPGIENMAKLNSLFECSYLIGNANIYNKRRKCSTDESAAVCTSPAKWPGVTNLRALLAREKDEDIPKLNVLLLESFIATYMSLVIYSLATCDCRLLYRLATQTFANMTWSTIFGGGMKKLLRQATIQNDITAQAQPQGELSDDKTDDNGVWNTVTSITKQRVKLNMKILGSFGHNNKSTHMKEDKPTYREQFVPPEMSMLSYFLMKPNNSDDDDYDTDDPYESDNEDEVDDEGAEMGTQPNKQNIEHLNPMSYSWNILRLAIIKLISIKIQDFINLAGIEIQDLPVFSPLSHEVLRTLKRWQDFSVNVLKSKGPPSEDYIPGCFVENSFQGLPIHKYRTILNKENTPFAANSSTGPIRRLWCYLVRQDHLQEVFIKAIFGKKLEHNTKTRSSVDRQDLEPTNSNDENEHIRVIHKDHESILSFCLHKNSGMIAVANPREIQELDISLLLESPNWYEDECDYDILNLSKEAEAASSTGFLVIQANEQSNHGFNMNSEPTVSSQPSLQSGRGTTLIMRHKMDNVKRMSSHPLLPLYISGGQDGSVQIWEWGHQQAVCTPRPSGTFAKVTRCRFSEQGNKFGIGDGDGNLSLWQAGIASQNNRSFFTYQCHNKNLSDFVFLGSCSLLATAGQSSENKNINIWDTLMPQKKSCVSAFTCHDQGSSCLVFAPQHQLIISCGKKGDVCIFDVRQRTLKHRFQAHDATIKCIALDPHEEFFATGSVEGDIKIWSLTQYILMKTFLAEHAKNSFFKHIGQGVSQIHIDSNGRLFSCGSDGCMKVRQLIEKDTIIQTLY